MSTASKQSFLTIVIIIDLDDIMSCGNQGNCGLSYRLYTHTHDDDFLSELPCCGWTWYKLQVTSNLWLAAPQSKLVNVPCCDTDACRHTYTHRHPSPHPLLLWNLSPRQRYVVVMDEGDDDDGDAYEDDNGDRKNNPRLNYKVQLTANECTAGLCSLQRGWKERRVILRNANRPFPHRKSDHSPAFRLHSMHVLLFQQAITVNFSRALRETTNCPPLPSPK